VKSEPSAPAGEPTIKVLLILNNSLARAGLRNCLAQEEGMEVVGDASDVEHAIPLAKKLQPRVLIVDERAVHQLRDAGDRFPNSTPGALPAMVLLAEGASSQMLDAALQAGVRGFLDPATAPECLPTAIQHVAAGERYVSPGLVPNLLNHEHGDTDPTSPPEAVLTLREMEVFQLTGQGFEAKEIGDRLNISPRTVDVHRANIRQKLGLGGVHELMRFATTWQQNQARRGRLKQFCEEDRPLLLVEDDEVDVLSVQRGLARLPARFRVEVARHGEEALKWLRSGDHPAPFMVLLDINMPRMNGHEFLGELRRDPALRTLPVVVLTTSPHDADRDRLYQLGITAYLVKPTTSEEYVEMLRSLAEFWGFNSPPPFPAGSAQLPSDSVVARAA